MNFHKPLWFHIALYANQWSMSTVVMKNSLDLSLRINSTNSSKVWEELGVSAVLSRSCLTFSTSLNSPNPQLTGVSLGIWLMATHHPFSMEFVMHSGIWASSARRHCLIKSLQWRKQIIWRVPYKGSHLEQLTQLTTRLASIANISWQQWKFA